MDNGTAKPCFAVDFLQGQAKAPQMTEVEQLYTLVSIVEAGSDTTRTAVLQMMAGAACYPAWVAKARKSLDEVCGANAERLPMLQDKERLPYITAVMKETLRWRPFLQTGVPHTASEDFEFKGYKFPAGTDFTWNAYNIALNENEYENPHEFIPDRFLNDDLDKYTKGHWAFGAGMSTPVPSYPAHCFVLRMPTNLPYRSTCLWRAERWCHQYVDCVRSSSILL